MYEKNLFLTNRNLMDLNPLSAGEEIWASMVLSTPMMLVSCGIL